jgi:hypothetical protein
MTDAIRTLLLLAAVHLSWLSVGAWAVIGSEAAMFPAWLASVLFALSIPPRWLGLP